MIRPFVCLWQGVRGGLVDFAGATEELDAERTRLLARLCALGKPLLMRCNALMRRSDEMTGAPPSSRRRSAVSLRRDESGGEEAAAEAAAEPAGGEWFDVPLSVDLSFGIVAFELGGAAGSASSQPSHQPPDACEQLISKIATTRVAIVADKLEKDER